MAGVRYNIMYRVNIGIKNMTVLFILKIYTFQKGKVYIRNRILAFRISFILNLEDKKDNFQSYPPGNSTLILEN